MYDDIDRDCGYRHVIACSLSLEPVCHGHQCSADGLLRVPLVLARLILLEIFPYASLSPVRQNSESALTIRYYTFQTISGLCYEVFMV